MQKQCPQSLIHFSVFTSMTSNFGVNANLNHPSLFEICTRPARLDDLLNRRLTLIPILMIEINQINAIMFGNALQSHKTIPVIDKADTDANTSKATCATYA